MDRKREQPLGSGASGAGWHHSTRPHFMAPPPTHPANPGVKAGGWHLGGYHRPDQTRPFWRPEPRLARQVMTAPVRCLRVDDSVGDAADLMRFEEVGILPIVDNEQRLQGVITDRDIVVRAFGNVRNERLIPVRDIMSRDLAVVGPDEDLDVVIDIMRTRRVQRVPVVDGDERLLGIISLEDIASRSQHHEHAVRETYQCLADRRPHPSHQEVPGAQTHGAAGLVCARQRAGRQQRALARAALSRGRDHDHAAAGGERWGPWSRKRSR